jgi:excisionase family DNA binding protein
MGKANPEYYNLEKVAEMLSVGTAEVNRLREQGKLRGFRDGNTWKFIKEDIHTYLANSIKARSATNGQQAGDSGFDLAGEESEFDFIVEDVILPDDDDLVSIAPSQSPSQAHQKSDLDLAAFDHEDSDLALADETQISSASAFELAEKPAETPEIPEVNFAQDDSQEEDDSSLFEIAEDSEIGDPNVHEVDFGDDDESAVLSLEGSSPQLGLAGDSAFDVLVADEEKNILEADDSASDEVIEVDDFDLEPLAKAIEDDDSESSSQVIAVDIGIDTEIQDGPSFEEDDGFSFDEVDFDSGLQPSVAEAQAEMDDPFGMGLGDASATMQQPGFATAPAVSVSPSKTPGIPEEEFSKGMLIAMAFALVILLLPGIMLVDAMMNMWSWNQPFILNSALMGMIAGVLGL